MLTASYAETIGGSAGSPSDYAVFTVEAGSPDLRKCQEAESGVDPPEDGRPDSLRQSTERAQRLKGHGEALPDPKKDSCQRK